MSALSRRSLFGLFAGAAIAPPWPKAAALNAVPDGWAFSEHTTWVRYSGYEVLNITSADILSAAEYDWKGVPAVTISGVKP